MEPLTALVVEDEEMLRTLIVNLLSSEEIRVDAFASPQHYSQAMDGLSCSCSEHHQTNCYDFILTDNRMPGMNGPEFLDRLEKSGCQLPPEHKAIFSGNWTAQEKDQAIERNYQVFTKPFAVSDILDWIDEVS